MVLSSQAPRPAMSYRYRSRRRRRRHKWPWAVIVLLGVSTLVWWQWWDNGGGVTAPPGPDGQRSWLDPGVVEPVPDGSDNATVDNAVGNEVRLGSDITLGGSSTESPPDRSETNDGRRTVSESAEPDIAKPSRSAPKPSSSTVSGASSVLDASPTLPLGRNSAAQVASALARGMTHYRNGKNLTARNLLNPLLQFEGNGLAPDDARVVRQAISKINDTLIFSDHVEPDDPLVDTYLIKSLDLLSVIAPQYKVPWELIAYINKVDPRRLQPGRNLKVIRGPFHAVVHKSDYRMDFFLKDRHGVSIYACSFQIGIGEDDSTPEGYFVVTRGGKLTDPDWKNPRTREYFAGGDPKNPIGKFWIGLTGTDEQTKDLVGYGIHGTIDPDSIGKTSSMGCIRLLTGDVELVFKTLVGQYSTVQIQK